MREHLILVPILLYGALIFQQAVAFLDWLRPHLEAREWDRFWREVVPQRSPKLANWLRQIGWEAPPLTAGLAPKRALFRPSGRWQG